MKENKAYVLLREHRYVGCFRLDSRIELPETERAIWDASGGDLVSFQSLLGDSYELIALEDIHERVPTGMLAERYDDARRYFFFVSGSD